MTYKLNPEIRKIVSPVTVTDGVHTWTFDSGAAAADAVFDRHYNITSYRAAGDLVEITVAEFAEYQK